MFQQHHCPCASKQNRVVNTAFSSEPRPAEVRDCPGQREEREGRTERNRWRNVKYLVGASFLEQSGYVCVCVLLLLSYLRQRISERGWNTPFGQGVEVGVWGGRHCLVNPQTISLTHSMHAHACWLHPLLHVNINTMPLIGWRDRHMLQYLCCQAPGVCVYIISLYLSYFMSHRV